MDFLPRIEGYRDELRRSDFQRLDDVGLVKMKRRVQAALHCVGRPDVYPNLRVAAFLDMMMEERAPDDVVDEFCNRYVSELIVKRVA